MRIAYFVHDTSDAAVLRRVRMLHASGASVRVLGFRRHASPTREVDGAPVVDLGRTFDGRLAHRAGLTLWHAAHALVAFGRQAPPDIFLARNLEMLLLASAARRRAFPAAALVYECLDIHRLMTSEGRAGRVLRSLERRLLGGCQLLIVSSPAHLSAYFTRFQATPQDRPAVFVLENKVFAPPPEPAAPRRAGPPWRIGWFGRLRCRRSLETLASLAARQHGRVEVLLAGRPSERELGDLPAVLAGVRHVAFTGAYDAGDLEKLYRSVHFAWAIDYFEAGQNSRWLLPNRLYEGGRYGAVPIGLRSVETGRWLEARRLGVVLDDAPNELDRFFDRLDAETWRQLETRSRCAPATWFSAGAEECEALRRALECIL